MKKLYAALFVALGCTATYGQMVFTGGPVNTSGQCWSLWAKGDTAFMGYNEGLYRTIDGGTTWTHLTNGITADADPRTIEFSNDKLIVGTNNDSRIYQSDDFGDSFNGGTGNITSIAIPTASSSGPNNSMIGGTLFQPYVFDFGTNDWISTGGSGFITTHGIKYLGNDSIWICRGSTTSFSHDNGSTWTDVATEPQTDIGGGVIVSTEALDFEKVGNRILVYTNLVGFPVLYTDDYGTTWQSSDLTGTSWSDYGKKFIRVNDNHLLTVTLDGVWKSTDQGATWTQIQSISKIRTMTLFKGSNLLVGTDEGVCEFDNHGEGSLLKKHGSPANASHLIAQFNGNLLAGTSSGIYEYNTTTELWSIFKDTNDIGMTLDATNLSKVDDTIYAMGTNGFHVSGDNGVTFTQGNNTLFNSNNTPTVFAKMDGKKFVATLFTGFGSPEEPEIYYSIDDGATYTEASFTNTVAYAYGGSGGNFVEQFLETPNALIADMNAGYAISTDGGVNWSYTGGAWDISFLAVEGTKIYHFRSTALPTAERIIEVSEDNGVTWTEVPQTGLPNSGGGNYQGIYGVWNLDGKISTYNSFEDVRGIYNLNTSGEWELVPNTASSIENWDGITGMYFFDDVIYTNWQGNGTWKTDGTNGIDKIYSDNFTLYIFPNPATNQLTIEFENPIEKVLIYDINGKQMNINVVGTNKLDISTLNSGIYIVQVTKGNATYKTKFIKQ